MITKIILGTTAVAAFGLTGLAAAPAQAAEVPTYTCENVELSPVTSTGAGNCQPSNGAPAEGPFEGESRLVSTDGGTKVRCQEGGVAQTPEQVEAYTCSPEISVRSI